MLLGLVNYGVLLCKQAVQGGSRPCCPAAGMEMGVTKQRSEPIYIEVSNKSSIATIGGVNMLKITICSFKLRDGPSPGFGLLGIISCQ